MKSQTVNFLLVAVFSTLSLGSLAQISIGKVKVNKDAVSAGEKIIDAARLSDEQVVEITKGYVQWMDEHNPVAAYESQITGYQKPDN